MLQGIHPLLTGALLARLDAMGHSDTLVVADANFPAQRTDPHALEIPGARAAEVVAAIRTVMPLDDPAAVVLMECPDGLQEVQRELVEAAGAPADFLDRFAFYQAAATSRLVIRTGETRPWGNALLTKGVVS